MSLECATRIQITLIMPLLSLFSNTKNQNSQCLDLCAFAREIRKKKTAPLQDRSDVTFTEMRFYTGINKLIFIFILNAIQENAKKYSKLMLKDHLLLVLMKLKLELLHSDLAYRFGINLSKVSRIYRNWLPLLSKSMENPQP